VLALRGDVLMRRHFFFLWFCLEGRVKRLFWRSGMFCLAAAWSCCASDYSLFIKRNINNFS
jgi:hypothetical protein